jgi:hypothetical protein
VFIAACRRYFLHAHHSFQTGLFWRSAKIRQIKLTRFWRFARNKKNTSKIDFGEAPETPAHV